MDVQPVGKFEWQAVVFRLDIPSVAKLVALAAAYFGNADGSRVFPSQQKIARMVGKHEVTVRGHLKLLRDLGLLTRVRRGGGRGGASDTYRLTVPVDMSLLPLWLDPNYDPMPTGEYRVLTLGVSVDNSEPPPVDNSETPSADARCFDPSEAPRDEKHRASASEYRAWASEIPSPHARQPDHDQTKTTPTPRVETQVTNSLARASPVPKTEAINGVEVPSDAEFEAGRDRLAAMPLTAWDRLRRQAEAELLAAGGPLTKQAVHDRTTELVELAQRPQTTNGAA